MGGTLPLPIGLPLPSTPATVTWIETPASSPAASPQLPAHGREGGGLAAPMREKGGEGLCCSCSVYGCPHPRRRWHELRRQRTHRRHHYRYRRTGARGGVNHGRQRRFAKHTVAPALMAMLTPPPPLRAPVPMVMRPVRTPAFQPMSPSLGLMVTVDRSIAVEYPPCNPHAPISEVVPRVAVEAFPPVSPRVVLVASVQSRNDPPVELHPPASPRVAAGDCRCSSRPRRLTF